MKMNKSNCLICERILKIKNDTNPFFVKEMETGYVVLGDHQYCEGYTLFLAKEHMTELHQLSHPVRLQFLQEFAVVSEAIYKAFKPKKLNYELLGNSHPHLHWHIFPRKEHPASPIWSIPKQIREKKVSLTKIHDLKKMLLKEINILIK